jgi:4a-hydroxytetrahydrobiopterin dehydratase
MSTMHSAPSLAPRRSTRYVARMKDLASRQCVPCRGGVPPLAGERLEELSRALGHGWEVVDGHHLLKTFRFPDFVTALDYVNAIGRMAEEQQHHPDLHLAWGKVTVEIWTHAIDGLTESDFVFAAKAELLYSERA